MGDLEFLKEVKADLKLNFPLLLGSKRTIKRILREYGNIKRIPILIIVDRKGKIVQKLSDLRATEEVKKIISSVY